MAASESITVPSSLVSHYTMHMSNLLSTLSGDTKKPVFLSDDDSGEEEDTHWRGVWKSSLDAMQGEGLGYTLMQKMVDYCRKQGVIEMMGTVLADNRPMLKLAEKLGFTTTRYVSAEVVEILLPLNEPLEDWQRSRLSRLHDVPVAY